MRLPIPALAVCFSWMVAPAQEEPLTELIPVPSVDLPKYCGTWFEIARLPNSFQRDCASEVTATYTLDGDELIVVNRCRGESGEMREVTGRARRATPDGPASKLKVRFAPALLSFLPFVWGDYWIIDLADDYSYAVVGEPDREYLWIRARTPSRSDAVLQRILGRIALQGYNIRNLMYTKQAGANAR